MTVTELRKMLEELEEEGYGDTKICVVSGTCEPISEYYEKFTTDIEPYFDTISSTFMICD